MGRFRALPLTISLLFLAACAGRGGQTGEELALAIQEEYRQFTAVTCQVALTAEYGERSFECVVDAAWDRETGATLTLVEPEIAQGVTARIAQGETSLVYDGFSLETGPLTGDGLSPLEAIPALWARVTRGYIAAADRTDNTLEVTYRQGDGPPGSGLEAVVTFDTQSHAPLTGELYADGTRIAGAQVSDFQSQSAPD